MSERRKNCLQHVAWSLWGGFNGRSLICNQNMTSSSYVSWFFSFLLVYFSISLAENTVMCRGYAWLIRRVLDWMNGFIAPYTLIQFGTTGDTALSLFYTLYNSPLHTNKGPQSSLVVSWQRIYPSLTVTSNHTWIRLFTIWFPSCHYSAAANSEDSTHFNSKLISRQAGIPKLDFWLYSTTVLFKIKVKVTLRLTVGRSVGRSVGQSVSLGVEPHLVSRPDI
jgi:hypothetical protein